MFRFLSHRLYGVSKEDQRSNNKSYTSSYHFSFIKPNAVYISNFLSDSDLALKAMGSTDSEPRSSGTEYQIIVDRVVYYLEETLTMETLAYSLIAYFSFLGASNLENYLTTVGFEKATAGLIYVGKMNIQFAEMEVEKENERLQKKNFFVNDEGELLKGTIVGLYILSVSVVVSIALFVIRYLVGRWRLIQDRGSQSCGSESSIKSSPSNDEESGIASTKLHSIASTKLHSNTSQTKKSFKKRVSSTVTELS